MMFAPIEWTRTVNKEVLDGFDRDTLTIRTDLGVGLADVEEVLI